MFYWALGGSKLLSYTVEVVGSPEMRMRAMHALEVSMARLTDRTPTPP